MGVELGGANAWKQHVKGDLVQSFQWVNDEPAMVFFPAHRTSLTGGAFIIPIEAAHNYAQSNGHPDLGYAIPTATQALAHMGMQVTRSGVHRLIDLILDGMPDLISMPPTPPDIVEQAVKQSQGANTGELTLKVDGETVMQDEISLNPGVMN